MRVFHLGFPMKSTQNEGGGSPHSAPFGFFSGPPRRAAERSLAFPEAEAAAEALRAAE